MAHSLLLLISSLYHSYLLEFQIALATIIGAIIGLERELRGKSAGIRTYAVIAMASCLFTIMSKLADGVMGSHDTTRIAAQIVSGIGFISGAVIWQKEGGVIEGLTTSASLWAVAALGMAIGYGFIGLAVSSAIMVLVIMECFGFVVKIAKRVKLA